MLVISRKKGEAIVVGDGIEVTIVEIRADKVRLGITTPGNVTVHRQEVYDAIKRASERPLWNDSNAESRSIASIAHRECLEHESRPVATLPVAASPATLTLAGPAVSQLDDLRRSAELSREAALETMLDVIDRAEVNSLCDLERRLRRPR